MRGAPRKAYPAMMDLLAKRLIVNSGKGGVGKTTISAALAIVAARRGKRVLLAEIDAADRLGPLFGRPAVSGREVQVADRIDAVNVDPILVAEEFVGRNVRFPGLAHQIVSNPIFTYFLEAGPALKELIALGAVVRLLERLEERTGRPRYDTVILDAPATGHGISLLNVPQAATDALFGPMKARAEHVRDVFNDRATTVLNIVTIPEEMAVNEAIDLYEQVRAKIPIGFGLLFVNSLHPRLWNDDEEEALATIAGSAEARGELDALLGEPRAAATLFEAARYGRHRAALCEQYRERVRRAIPLPAVEVPFIFNAAADRFRTDFDRAVVDEVAAILDETLEKEARRAAP